MRSERRLNHVVARLYRGYAYGRKLARKIRAKRAAAFWEPQEWEVRRKWTPPKMGVDDNLGMYVQKIPFVPIQLARPRILQGPKDVCLDKNEANDHEQPRSVPLVPMLPGGSKDTP